MSPMFPDHCKHTESPNGTFVGTVLYRDQPHDVYIYKTIHLETHICLRYGEEGGDYVSAGRLDRFLSRAIPLLEDKIR